MQPVTNDTSDGAAKPRRSLKDRIRQLKWHLGLACFVLLSLPVALLPRRLAVGLGGAVGRLAYLLLGRMRRTTVDNIRSALPYLQAMPGWDRAHGSPEEIAVRTFANLGRTAVEVIKLHYGLGDSLVEQVEWRGVEHYRKAKEQGKGVLFITGHFDNWELAALSFGTHLDGVAVVARRQKYAPLTEFLERLRKRFGNSLIYADGAARNIFFRLRKNETIGVLMDQAVQPNEGAIVEFFGRGAWTTTMPALIAAKTGAVLLPAFSHREGNRHVVDFYPEILPDPAGDPIATTRLLNRCIEEQIARHPDQWLWVYRRWKRVKG
ncbi:MAG: lipid A biosynthesis acyltransferase [Desulfuromonadales bacterium]|nr:MAG: lipid A biosynthesis acyltransferase [Desulfuromonadales bacterium]